MILFTFGSALATQQWSFHLTPESAKKSPRCQGSVIPVKFVEVGENEQCDLVTFKVHGEFSPYILNNLFLTEATADWTFAHFMTAYEIGMSPRNPKRQFNPTHADYHYIRAYAQYCLAGLNNDGRRKTTTVRMKQEALEALGRNGFVMARVQIEVVE